MISIPYNHAHTNSTRSTTCSDRIDPPLEGAEEMNVSKAAKYLEVLLSFGPHWESSVHTFDLSSWLERIREEAM